MHRKKHLTSQQKFPVLSSTIEFPSSLEDLSQVAAEEAVGFCGVSVEADASAAYIHAKLALCARDEAQGLSGGLCFPQSGRSWCVFLVFHLLLTIITVYVHASHCGICYGLHLFVWSDPYIHIWHTDDLFIV